MCRPDNCARMTLWRFVCSYLRTLLLPSWGTVPGVIQRRGICYVHRYDLVQNYCGLGVPSFSWPSTWLALEMEASVADSLLIIAQRMHTIANYTFCILWKWQYWNVINIILRIPSHGVRAETTHNTNISFGNLCKHAMQETISFPKTFSDVGCNVPCSAVHVNSVSSVSWLEHLW